MLDRTGSGRVGTAYRALIDSERVSANTRNALLERGQADDPAYQPGALTPAQLGTLRAVLARVVPQSGIDLAARVDAMLASGTGDGWRFADLPADAAACRAALATLDAVAQGLHGHGFTELDADVQDGLLARMAEGRFEPGRLDPKQMRLWFEDTRAAAVRLYVAHPATLARMGYSGIGYGGDGEPKSGFVHVGADEREAWEPLPDGAL